MCLCVYTVYLFICQLIDGHLLHVGIVFKVAVPLKYNALHSGQYIRFRFGLYVFFVVVFFKQKKRFAWFVVLLQKFAAEERSLCDF